MKALTMTLVAALTLIATTSNASMVKLPCGKWQNIKTSRGNEIGVLNASNAAQYKISPAESQSTGVSSHN